MKGDMLGGRYQLEDRIGGGGMAWVWRADDTLLHRPVAIKVLREEFAGDEAFVRRFRQEAQAVASLVHPNVVHVYDVGEENGLYYIVMELVEGETLKERIQRQGPLPIGRALQVTAAIARALAAAHRKGIVHRDIKPQNILLTREGRVKVADFGIARAASGTTIVHTNTIIGSAHYFAPEQARGGFTDTKSDLYSVGAVLYEMLTGQPPFEGATPVAVALQHIQEPPVSPRKRRPEVSRSVESMVLRLLEKEPAKRYQSAEALLQDLHRSLDEIGEPYGDEAETEDGETEAPGIREPRGARKPPRRRPARWWPWAVLVLLIAALGYGGIHAFYAYMNGLPTIRVARVEGLTLKKAQSALRKDGLGSHVLAREHANAKRDTVLSQEPGAGEIVKRGRVVSLVVSQGPQVVPVPDVVGMTEADAKLNLSGAGFQAVPMNVQSQQPQGTVVAQSPKAGRREPQNTVVTISLSQGPAQTQLTVPPVVGLSLSRAITDMGDVSVTVTSPDYAFSTAVKDTVLEQSVPAGTQVTNGMTVILTISKGYPPIGGTGPQQSEPITVSYTGQGTATVLINLVDATGYSTVYNQPLVSGASPVPINVQWYGNGRLEVFLNGQLVSSQALPLAQPTIVLP